MNSGDTRRSTSFWRSWTGIALCGVIAFGALSLILEHGAHALQWLPLALLLACPLMHLFHDHGGHGHHDGPAPDQGDGEPYVSMHPGTIERPHGRSDDELTK